MTLIEQLRKGKIAIENLDGTLEDLIRVLKYAFPKDYYQYSNIVTDNRHLSKYYKTQNHNLDLWIDAMHTGQSSYPISAFIKEMDNKTIKKTIKYTEAQAIIDLACKGEWQPKLAKLWGVDIAMKKDIEVSEELYHEGRNAANGTQNKLLDNIFGSDIKYKVDDWVVGWHSCCHPNFNQAWQIQRLSGIYAYSEKGHNTGIANLRMARPDEIKKATALPAGTPCLVRHRAGVEWVLRYADGDGGFYQDGKKSGHSYNWAHFYKLDPSTLLNLPE